jgi:hypothetical protein
MSIKGRIRAREKALGRGKEEKTIAKESRQLGQ